MKGMMVHCGATVMDRDQIASLPAPQALGPRHRPLVYGELLSEIDRALEVREIRTVHEEYAVGMRRGEVNNGMLFGLRRLEADWWPATESALTMGLRTSIVQSYATTIVAGASVFVCDNLALLGDSIVFKRKSTTGMRLAEEVDAAVAEWRTTMLRFEDRMAALGDQHLTDVQAYYWTARLVRANVIPARSLKPVLRNWHDGEAGAEDKRDLAPRSLLGLHNAVTRELRALPMHLQLDRSQRLSRELAA